MSSARKEWWERVNEWNKFMNKHRNHSAAIILKDKDGLNAIGYPWSELSDRFSRPDPRDLTEESKAKIEDFYKKIFQFITAKKLQAEIKEMGFSNLLWNIRLLMPAGTLAAPHLNKKSSYDYLNDRQYKELFNVIEHSGTRRLDEVEFLVNRTIENKFKGQGRDLSETDKTQLFAEAILESYYKVRQTEGLSSSKLANALENYLKDNLNLENKYNISIPHKVNFKDLPPILKSRDLNIQADASDLSQIKKEIFSKIDAYLDSINSLHQILFMRSNKDKIKIFMDLKKQINHADSIEHIKDIAKKWESKNGAVLQKHRNYLFDEKQGNLQSGGSRKLIEDIKKIYSSRGKLTVDVKKSIMSKGG